MQPHTPALIAETSATLLDFYTLFIPPSLLLATRVNLKRGLNLPPSLETFLQLVVLLACYYAIVVILWQIRMAACSCLWMDRSIDRQVN